MKGNTLKIIGVILILISIGTIVYNVKYVKPVLTQIAQDPLKALKPGGKGIKEYHDFKPPFTVFEYCIFGVGLVGVVALVIPIKSKDG